ncbi:MAG TPA: preprotein translocase subunit SecE [Gemmatimonadales bacterium]|nr:preprotein translocase subunit SecE [Gemmatimonadales bacterium]
MSLVEKMQGGVRGTVQFLVEVRSEVQKITWPSKDEVRRLTLVILGFVVFMAVLIGLMDILLQLILVRGPSGLFS